MQCPACSTKYAMKQQLLNALTTAWANCQFPGFAPTGRHNTRAVSWRGVARPLPPFVLHPLHDAQSNLQIAGLVQQTVNNHFHCTTCGKSVYACQTGYCRARLPREPEPATTVVVTLPTLPIPEPTAPTTLVSSVPLPASAIDPDAPFITLGISTRFLFDMIEHKLKLIELRLNYPEIDAIKEGDVIEFTFSTHACLRRVQHIQGPFKVLNDIFEKCNYDHICPGCPISHSSTTCTRLMTFGKLASPC